MNSGLASLVLLSTLRNTDELMYGYQIAKLLEENSGLLDSKIEPSVSGPPRKYYEITSEGRETLVVWQGVWKQMKSFVDKAMKGTSR